MEDFPARLRAVCDLEVAEVRELSGRHEYDGIVQDLSPDGVRQGLARLTGTAGGPLEDPHDEAHLATFERQAQVAFGDLELHRRSPLPHLDALDLACYDREYAPAAERDRARLEHLAAWPRAVDSALAALDRLSSPVAAALRAGNRGRAAATPPDAPAGTRAAAADAHARLAAHVERAATEGDPDPSLGAAGLTALMGSAESIDVDLGRLAERADAERDRLVARGRGGLDSAGDRLHPGT